MMPTLKDIAEKAGVAPSTVSRVINDNPRISDKTKRKVKRIMKELGYHPNLNARNLVKQRSHNMGILIPNSADEAFSDPFFAEILRGIGGTAQSEGFNLLLLTGESEDDELNTVLNAVKSKQIDGLLVLRSKKDDKLIKELKNISFPLVIVGRPENEEEYFWVNNDNIKSAQNAVDYLIKMGHRKIAAIIGNQNFTINQDRLEGYLNSLKNHGLKIDADFIYELKLFDHDSIFKTAARILKRKSGPTAIFTVSDSVAYSIVQAADKLGKKVPQDLSVVGFNNNPMSKFLNPPLTTVDINIKLLGKKAAELLTGVINNRFKDYQHIIVPSEIIKRNSCQNLDS